MGLVRLLPDQARPGLNPGWAGRCLGGALVGLAAGLPVGLLLTYQGTFTERGVVPAWLVYLVSVATVGAVIGLIVGYRPGGLAAAASGGVLVGLLGWLMWSLTLGPVLHGKVPTWSIDAAARTYRDLVGGLLHGGLTGALLHGLTAVRAGRARLGPQPVEQAETPRVVIVGGGFAGVGAAQRFEHHARRGGSLDVTLISDSNFLLFTPMLADVAAGALE
ncbi:MAG: hypothetical protein ACRDR6_09715, partial [Pseudonocardiaceae bacterium]